MTSLAMARARKRARARIHERLQYGWAKSWPTRKGAGNFIFKTFQNVQTISILWRPPFKNVHALSKNLSFSHCSLHSIQRIAKAGALARTGTSAQAKGPGFWRQAGDHSGGRREKKDYNMKTPNLKLTFLGDGAYGRERGPGPGLGKTRFF